MAKSDDLRGERERYKTWRGKRKAGLERGRGRKGKRGMTRGTRVNKTIRVRGHKQERNKERTKLDDIGRQLHCK